MNNTKEQEAFWVYKKVLSATPETVAKLSPLACQRAIWRIYHVEVDGYDHKKDNNYS